MDIFLHTSEQEAEGTLRKIFKAVQKNQARITKRKLLVTRSKNAVTFPKGAYMSRRRPSHTHVAPALQVTLTTPEVLSCGRS